MLFLSGGGGTWYLGIRYSGGEEKLTCKQGKKTEQLLKKIQEPFRYTLANFADVFEAFSKLNRNLQDPYTTL